MKKVKKMGTGGLPVGSPEKGGGVKRPPQGLPVDPRRVGQQPVKPTPRPTPRPNPNPGKPAVQQPVRQVEPRPAQPSQIPRQATVTGAPAPRPSGAMVPVRGGGMAPASIATMMKKGGKVSSASKRADGIASKGKTKGRMI